MALVHTGLLLFVLWYWWKPKSSNYMVGFFVGKASRNVRNNWICKFQTKLFESGYSWYSLHFFYFLTPFYYTIYNVHRKKSLTPNTIWSRPQMHQWPRLWPFQDSLNVKKMTSSYMIVQALFETSWQQGFQGGFSLHYIEPVLLLHTYYCLWNLKLVL